MSVKEGEVKGVVTTLNNVINKKVFPNVLILTRALGQNS